MHQHAGFERRARFVGVGPVAVGASAARRDFDLMAAQCELRREVSTVTRGPSASIGTEARHDEEQPHLHDLEQRVEERGTGGVGVEIVEPLPTLRREVRSERRRGSELREGLAHEEGAAVGWE